MPYAPLDTDSIFSSAFLAGALPWAVWTAILASKDKDGFTALTPEFLARQWKLPLTEIKAAWQVHADPDPLSKRKEHGGRRLIPTEDGRWFVVSHEHYRDKHRTEKRREQLRLAQRRRREREKQEDPEYQGPSPEETAKAFKPPTTETPAQSPQKARFEEEEELEEAKSTLPPAVADAIDPGKKLAAKRAEYLEPEGDKWL